MFLELDHLTKKFPARDKSGQVAAVNDVSLEINKGEFVTLLGPSGCGKTTTLRLIAGFEFPTSGKIILDGKQLEDVPPNKRDMAMVFQSYAIFPHLSVLDNIAYGLEIRKFSKSDMRDKIQKVIALTKLTGLENRAPNQISGGQQQRVALARALVVEPKVLLFDEPLSNLDAKLREEMRFEIRDLQKRLGITAIYVTHDQQEALVMSDKVAVMNNGRLMQLGSPQDIYENPKSKFVAEFIGLSDFISARIETIDGKTAQVVVGQTRLTATAAPGFAAQQSALLFIRPNDVAIVENGGDKNILSGTVQQATYLGETMDYRVQVNEDLELRVQASGTRRYAIGEGVHLHLPAERLRLIAEE